MEHGERELLNLSLEDIIALSNIWFSSPFLTYGKKYISQHQH